jgi:hypothetical protein
MGERTTQSEPVETGATLQIVLGEINRLIKEQFGERDAEIFRRYDAGEKSLQIAKSFDLTGNRIKQIASNVQRFVNQCFSGKRLRVLPLIQRLQGGPKDIDIILAAAGFEIDKGQYAALVKREELALQPQTFKTELDHLNLSARSRNALVNHGITTVEDLHKLTCQDLDVIRGIGPASIRNIQQALQLKGFHLSK